MGKKTWTPGKTLPRFIAGTFGIPLRDQALLVEAIGDAVTEVVPLVQEKMAEQADFRDIGKADATRMAARRERFTREASLCRWRLARKQSIRGDLGPT
jgi:hypothetical protein